MEDLLEIHYEKLTNNESSLCPALWLRTYEAKMKIEDVLFWEKEVPVILSGEVIDKGYKFSQLQKLKPYCEELGQIMAHKSIADFYRVSPIPNRKMEEGARARILFNNPDMKWEIKTPVGRIDCMSSEDIIEIKAARSWKAGIGQLVSYGYFYPKHNLILHLYGYLPDDLLRDVVKVAERIGIRVQTKC